MTTDEIIHRLDGFKPNTRAWAIRWIIDGMPWPPPYPNEHHIITASLHQFRKSLLQSSEEVMARVKKAVEPATDGPSKIWPEGTAAGLASTVLAEPTTTVVELQQAGVNAAQLVENYIKLRNKIAELKEAFKTRITPILELQQKIEGILMRELDKLKAQSLKTNSGTAFTQVETSAIVEDWEKTLEHIQTGELWDLLERRVAKGALLSIMEERRQAVQANLDAKLITKEEATEQAKGILVPGVKISQIRVLRVRTA